MSQSQDYSKGGYVGNTQGQTKGTGANASSSGTTGNDLSAMYGKSHTAIGKVNVRKKYLILIILFKSAVVAQCYRENMFYISLKFRLKRNVC